MAEKKTTKKKTKPMPVAIAVALIVIAVALMASFVYYVIKPPKDASAGGDYSGTQDFGEQSENEYNLELGELKDDIKDAEMHDVISLGKYEQDGNTENGKETIEWIVLEKNDMDSETCRASVRQSAKEAVESSISMVRYQSFPNSSLESFFWGSPSIPFHIR